MGLKLSPKFIIAEKYNRSQTQVHNPPSEHLVLTKYWFHANLLIDFQAVIVDSGIFQSQPSASF